MRFVVHEHSPDRCWIAKYNLLSISNQGSKSVKLVTLLYPMSPYVLRLEAAIDPEQDLVTIKIEYRYIGFVLRMPQEKLSNHVI